MIDSLQGLRPDGRLVTMGVDAEPLAFGGFAGQRRSIDIYNKGIRKRSPHP